MFSTALFTWALFKQGLLEGSIVILLSLYMISGKGVASERNEEVAADVNEEERKPDVDLGALLL